MRFTTVPSECAYREEIRTAIRAAIRTMRKRGTVGASIECLKANISTRGLTCPVPYFHNRFPALAAEVVAEFRGFKLS